MATKATGGGGVDRLLIKVILPKQGKERPNPTGGAPPTPFREVSDQFRSRLNRQVDAIKTVASARPGMEGMPIRVKLLPRAIAKSHRPDHLFSAATCPIIGAGKPGELFLKATSDGLAKLESTIRSNRTQQVVKELSAVEAIEPVTPLIRRRGKTSLDILRRSPRTANGFMTRIRLFNYTGAGDQESLANDFVQTCKRRKLTVVWEPYAPVELTVNGTASTISPQR